MNRGKEFKFGQDMLSLWGVLKSVIQCSGLWLKLLCSFGYKRGRNDRRKISEVYDRSKKIDTLTGEMKFYEFIKLFAQQKYLRLGDVEAMLSIDKEEAKAIVNQLAKMRMILLTSGGYRKTPRFNAYIAYCMKKGLFDHIQDEYY